MGKIIQLEDFESLKLKDIVHCHGVFDVLHVGHLEYLKSAKLYGVNLVVSITSDQYVNKGPGRPYFDQQTRAEMIAALECVDYVTISDDPSAVPAIKAIRPRYYVKGPDYRDMAKDPTGQIYIEEAAVRSCGGMLAFTDTPTHSSSAIINKFFNPWNDEQLRVVNEIKSLGGMEQIHKALDKIEKELKVLVVGELIWDIYRFVKPEGISSKSPSVSCRFSHEESYQGGAWAIYNHVKSFCDVKLISSTLQHEKIRYISADTGQRLLEITDHPEGGEIPFPWPEHNLCIVADFGHGLLDRNKLKTDSFVALNVQANSSNYGFNVFTKYEEWDYLVLDQREIRLAYNDRESSPIDLGHRAHGFNCAPVGLTLGPHGSAFFSDGKAYQCPAFADKIVDTIGAGDAYFALTSLLVRVGTNPRLTSFLGNVFAGLKTKIIGNKASVTKAQLLKACSSILA